MDPAFITSVDWHGIGVTLRFLWAGAFFVIGFAFSLLLSHAILPSVVTSSRFSPKLHSRVTKLRALLYLTALASLAMAILLATNAIHHAEVIANFFPRWLF